MINEKIKREIALLPSSPGVYLMKDEAGTIIYVGKAKNLQKRVSQYFLRPQAGKVQAMVLRIRDFDTILTSNEKEALILEMNLIKEHYPRYNVLLKDNSHYPYIAISKSHDPYLKIVRDKRNKNMLYFGPYPNSSSAYQIVNLLNKIFPLRKCKTLPKIPCLYYHLGQCLAPCIQAIDQATYDDLIKQITRFLKGYDGEVSKAIEQKMFVAARDMKYELAAEYKKTLDAIKAVQLTQSVEAKDKIERDIFAYSAREGYRSLAVLVYRRGLLLGKETFVVEAFDEESEQISDLIFQYYQKHELPKEIIVADRHIAKHLQEIYEQPVILPTRGKKLELITLAKTNAAHSLDEHFLTARLEDNQDALLQELGQQLKIKTPYFIVLFDNAHLQGSSPVGAMVAFINGEPVKKLYRKFHLDQQNAGNDVGAMKEIITRRFKRAVEANERLADLIIVDGGLAQVNAANNALQELNLSIPVAGLVKNDKHQTRGLINRQNEIVDLGHHRKLFFLLMRMQDEVHRYAISFHRKTREKGVYASIFDDVAGLGSKRKMSLQKVYQSPDALKQATLDDLRQLLPKKVAEALYKKIHLEDV